MGTSVGVISLDLVIKENLQKQLDKIRSTIQSGFQKPIETVSKAVDKTFDGLEKSVDNFKTATKTSMEKLSADAVKPMEEMQKKANESLSKVNSAASNPITKKINVKTVTAKELLDAQGIEDPINKINEKIAETGEEIKEKLGKFEIQTDPVKRLEQELENTKEKADLLQKKWQELNTELGKAQSEADASKIISQINATEKQLISLQSHMGKLQKKINSSMSGGSAFESIKAKISDVSKGIKSKISSAASKAGSAVKKTLGGAFNSLKSVGGKAFDSLKSKIGKFKSSADGASKPLSKLGKSIKSAAKSALLMAGLYAVFRGLKSAITNACSGNEEFAKSLNSIKANLNIAFAPIMNAIMPAINTLMSGLAAVTKQLAAFTSELFGSTYKKSLETVKQIKNVGKEAKKNSTYLASFDEMNVAQDTSSNDKSDGGVDYSDINGDNVKLPDWAERMKEAIRSGDWKGVGSLLAEKLNSAVDGINWGKIQSKVNGFMSGLANGLNGFIETINWGKLGNAFGNGINTIFGGMYTFIKKFNWSKLGKGIADFLNGAIKKADWALIGRTLASRWTALIDTLYAFVTNFDFSGFGISIGEAVNAWFDEIDWAKLGETISESIKGLFDTIMGFLETVDWQKIGEDIGEFICGIDWFGIAEKIFEVVKEALESAVTVLWEVIRKIVDGVSEWFDKLSPKMKILVGVIETLTAGFIAYKVAMVAMSIIDKVKKATEGMTIAQRALNLVMNLNPIGIVVSAIAGLVAAFVLLWKKSDKFRNFWIGLWDKIKSTVKSVVEAMKPIFEKIIAFIKPVIDKVKKIFSSIIDFFKNVFTGNWSKAWESIKDIFKNAWDALFGIVKVPINLIIDGINMLWSGIYTAVKGIVDSIGGIAGAIGDLFGQDWHFSMPDEPPLIPKLAKGGLATAPTLAMVGDNRNAKADPEVIAPLSKLQGMLTDGAGVSEIIALLREIVDILKSLDFTFEGKINERTLWKAIVKLYREHKIRTGGATI